MVVEKECVGRGGGGKRGITVELCAMANGKQSRGTKAGVKRTILPAGVYICIQGRKTLVQLLQEVELAEEG